MQMNKPVKVVVGLATAWTLVYPMLFMAVWFSSFFGMVLMTEEIAGTMLESVIPFGFMAIFPLHC